MEISKIQQQIIDLEGKASYFAEEVWRRSKKIDQLESENERLKTQLKLWELKDKRKVKANS